MSAIPQEIPDFGSAQVAPLQNPEFSPSAGFTTEDYFVWSRLDGRTSLRDVILMTGLAPERAIEILRKLRRDGAVLLPGEAPRRVAPRPAPATAAPRPAPAAAAPPPASPPRSATSVGALDDDERRALAETVDLDDGEKQRIIEVMRLVRRGDYFALLGVTHDVDKRELKRAYFRVSKEFHPDRHYKHELGSFGPWLSQIFETSTRAFQTLSNDSKRQEHADAVGGVVARPKRDSGSQNRSEHAAELFQRGCDAEVAGDLAEALKLLAAAVRIDPRPRYLRRAASCALICGELSEAEEYAKKAASLRADDASYARVLADVHRAAGRWHEAEEVLLGALQLHSASDLLSREIESDLAAVRAARKGP